MTAPIRKPNTINVNESIVRYLTAGYFNGGLAELASDRHLWHNDRMRAEVETAAVLVITVRLAGQDPELDSSTAVPWPVWRFGHLLLAAVLAAFPVLLVQELGHDQFDAAFVVRNSLGMVGLASLTTTAAGARFASAAPVLWWAVSAIMPPAQSVPGRIISWPFGPFDDQVAMWTAAVLFVSGIAAYSARGWSR